MNNININQQVLLVSILQISDGKKEGEAISITLSDMLINLETNLSHTDEQEIKL